MSLETAITKLEKTIEIYQKRADELAEFNKNRLYDFCDEYFKAENNMIEEVKERTQ
jgi:hypothetical protein